MSEFKFSPIPQKPDGSHDTDLVKSMYMTSEFMDWTRFAEKQKWDPHFSRRLFPVKTWQEEKKKILVENQGDIILNTIHERKFRWTRDILETLERYPKLVDKGSMILEAKMDQVARMYQEYVEWYKAGKHTEKYFDKRAGRNIEKRVVHPFEKISLMDISFLTKGVKDITDAKMKALMLDKWAVNKLDIPTNELEPQSEEKAIESGLTIEGGKELKFEEIQKWYDRYYDKPLDHTTTPANTPNPVQKNDPPTPSGIEILDDNGRPITKAPNG